MSVQLYYSDKQKKEVDALSRYSIRHRCCLPMFPFRLLASDIYFSGVKNLTALGNLIKWQKVSYDFKYHQQDFPADVPVLALSEGKSLLPVSVLAYDIHTRTCIYI